MTVSETNPNRRDIFKFARENKEKFTDLVEQTILEFKNVKVGFGLEVKFSIERNGETQAMKHYLFSVILIGMFLRFTGLVIVV